MKQSKMERGSAEAGNLGAARYEAAGIRDGNAGKEKGKSGSAGKKESTR